MIKTWSRFDAGRGTSSTCPLEIIFCVLPSTFGIGVTEIFEGTIIYERKSNNLKVGIREKCSNSTVQHNFRGYMK